ncbi:MAG TPA: hypothetical protein VGE63_02220 [Candidatus Paceibacterota bacterium]
MNRIADSLIWIILVAAAIYGVYVAYTSLLQNHGTMAFDSQSPLLKDVKGAPTPASSNPVQASNTTQQTPEESQSQPEEQTTTPAITKSFLTQQDIARIQAIKQADFDRFMRRLDDLIGESVTIKKESMGKRVSEYREIINLTLNQKLPIVAEAGDAFVAQVNTLKKALNLPQDSVADKPLHEALKKLLFDARNS